MKALSHIPYRLLAVLLCAAFFLGGCASGNTEETTQPPETTAPVEVPYSSERTEAAITYVEEYGYLQCGPEQVFSGLSA